MVDYRKHLGSQDGLILPYLGGPFVFAPDRKLRIAGEATPGWWRFRVRGRTAYPEGTADPAGLSEMPVVRGHLVSDRLVYEGARAELVLLLPEEEPPLLSPCVARRAPSGDLIFDTLDFEGEAEEAARRALLDDRTLADVKGVAATLRAAFGYALLDRVSGEIGISVTPGEARSELAAIAEGGRPVAEELLRRLAYERHAAEQAREAWRRDEAHRLAQAQAARPAHEAITPRWLERGPPAPRRRASQDDPTARADAALWAAGARLAGIRRLGSDQIEVRFAFMGEHFIAIAAEATLQIVDAGICLSGSDREVTLESLPSVIREAIETSRLVITRRG